MVRFIKKLFSEIKATENQIYEDQILEYQLGKYQLRLPKKHLLKKYQETFPLYDKFLPLLCSEFKGLIIDIGANIGDSSIAVFSMNDNSFIVGVEPDLMFFELCIDNIKSNHLNNRFLGINNFISSKAGRFKSEISKSLSTASIKANDLFDGEINSISFSRLMEIIPSDYKNDFEILKIDTDGYDWDIIDSFYDYCLSSCVKPRFVFFEMQTYLNDEFDKEDYSQLAEKYLNSLNKLLSIGYNNFCLFDNYGTPIKMTKSISEIFELNDYIRNSQLYNNFSTIYYLDVLVFGDGEVAYVQKKFKELLANKC